MKNLLLNLLTDNRHTFSNFNYEQEKTETEKIIFTIKQVKSSSSGQEPLTSGIYIPTKSRKHPECTVKNFYKGNLSCGKTRQEFIIFPNSTLKHCTTM